VKLCHINLGLLIGFLKYTVLVLLHFCSSAVDFGRLSAGSKKNKAHEKNRPTFLINTEAYVCVVGLFCK